MPIGQAGELEERDALYYPYIHIQSVDWLKRTLIVFPHITRILPDGFSPGDDQAFVTELTKTETSGGPLLRGASLRTQHVLLAQHALIQKLHSDISRKGEKFLRRYGKDAAERLKKRPTHWGGAANAGTATARLESTSARSRPRRKFYLHPAKGTPDLIHYLHENGLAWYPANQGPFLELHPRIGQAVMSTIAVACAQDEGLDIVTDPTDEDSCELNSCLASQGAAEIYNTWVHPRAQGHLPKRADGRAILDLIVYNHCDATKLTAKALAKLSDEREAFAKLKNELKQMAATIPAMMDETKVRERLIEKAREVLKRWEADRVNLSKIARSVFGGGEISDVGDAMQKIVDKLAGKETGSAVAAAAGVHSLLHGGPLLSAAAGIGIGVLCHVARSVRSVRESATQSPFRYLTLLERSGVAFTLGT
jgi:hypothetical protein